MISNRLKKYGDRRGKKRIGVWLEPGLLKELSIEAKDKSVTRQSIMEGALRNFINRVPREDFQALLLRRMNRQDTKLKRIESRLEILAESFAMYLRMWLVVTPEVPESQKEASIMQARERYDRYLKALGKKLRTGESLFTELPGDVCSNGAELAEGEMNKSSS